MIQDIPFDEDLLRGISQPLLVIPGEELSTISSRVGVSGALGSLD